MNLSDSDSPLSSPPESADEAPISKRHVNVKRTKHQRKAPPKTKPKAPAPPPRSPSPPPRKRKKEPPHVSTLADSPELAFIVMFRSRFADAFKGAPNLGCQDIERGIVDSTPSEQVEQLLCRLISLVLNRKKPVERGHHNRALEEAVHAHQAQWPRQWEGRNPMPGGRSFADLDARGRLILLKALINWALLSSEQIRTAIAENYKGSRREDDLNVPLSVQAWGKDGDKRKYWLIEGRDDTPFRLYRESGTALRTNTWINLAGTMDEIRQVAKELEEDDGTKHAMALKQKIEAAIPRFEEGERKRQKREYRLTRKAAFTQPGGISLYEGRTRGKRIKYTFSDNEDEKDSEIDDNRSRRSLRSTRNTPQPDAPRFTASGRQIRKPQQGAYGETKINGSHGTDLSTAAPTRDASTQPYNLEDDHVQAEDSGVDDEVDEWKGDSLGEDNDVDDESEWDDSGFLNNAQEKKSLRIILKVNKDRLSRATSTEKDMKINGGRSGTGTDGSGRLSVQGKQIVNGDTKGTYSLIDQTNGGRGPPCADGDISMKDTGVSQALVNGHPAKNKGTGGSSGAEIQQAGGDVGAKPNHAVPVATAVHSRM